MVFQPLPREKLAQILIKDIELSIQMFKDTGEDRFMDDAIRTSSRLTGLIWKDLVHYGIVSEDTVYCIQE